MPIERKSPTYTAKEANTLAGKLSLYNDEDSDLNLDYQRARLLIASLLTDKTSQDKYIARLEALNDKLISFTGTSL
jgi:hypothetical protein